ncbi:GAF domain-containing protein [Fulvimarina sp. MAC8]|uniref:GAF domain-containing protein n=1 Tax=Fulvimarina sp. MAC8 TaxID=3162874 RepID=UPI0032F03732
MTGGISYATRKCKSVPNRLNDRPKLSLTSMFQTNISDSRSASILALRQSGLLDRSGYEQFGHLTDHVRDILEVPVATVTLVDENRQVFAGHSGLPAPWDQRGETPITHSFCQHVVDRHAPLIVEDARLDPLLKDNPAIGDIGVVAYLGVPLSLPDGEIVGALAAIHNEPHSWSDTDIRRLNSVAQMVEKEMSVRISEHRWHSLFHSLQEGFLLGRVVRDENGHIYDWRYEEVNTAWYDLIGLPHGSVIGRTVRELIPEIEDAWVEEFANVVRTGRPIRFTRQVGQLDRWYDGVAQSVGGDRFTVIFIEVTDRIVQQRRQDALIRFGDELRDLESVSDITFAAAHCVSKGIPADRVGFGPVDFRSETIDVPLDWCATDIASVAGTHEFRSFGSYIENLKRGETVAIHDVTADERTVDSAEALASMQIRALLNLPVIENGQLVLVVFAHSRNPHVWSDEELQFVRQVGDRTQAAIGRVRAEETQAILNGELSHRLKNSFAMVQAIATQTLKGVEDRDAVNALSKRLRALSNAHDVLLQESWASARLRDVVTGVLAVFEAGDRFVITGRSIEIGPRATLSLSLLLHELGTNAAKYGALSVPDGCVEIAWTIRQGEDEERLYFSWRERGGPPAKEPEGRGFGSRIIRTGLIGAGNVELKYGEQGFEAAMSASLAQMQQT